MRLRHLCFALAAGAALAVPIVAARSGDPVGDPVGSDAGPLLVSPTTAAVPAPTAPDASSYLALGLPAPPPPPASPQDHPIEVPGVNAPFETSPPTTVPAPTSTIASLAQSLSLRVERADSSSSESSSGRSGNTVLGSEITRQPTGPSTPRSGPFAFTGMKWLSALIAAALALISVGVFVHLAARRRAAQP